jgi:hypothetical protein
MDIATAITTPATIRLGDADYMISPLSLADMASFRRWASERAINDAKERVKFLSDNGALNPQEKERTLAAAFDDTKNGAAEARAAASLDGAAYILWLALRRHHQDLKFEKVAELVTVANVDQLQQKLGEISGMTTTGDAGPNALAASAST